MRVVEARGQRELDRLPPIRERPQPALQLVPVHEDARVERLQLPAGLVGHVVDRQAIRHVDRDELRRVARPLVLRHSQVPWRGAHV